MRDTIFSELDALCAGANGPVGVAVSGGGDSLALLFVASDWAKACGQTLVAFTVDHGLRAEAADEAQMVARYCADLGIEHQTLCWQPPEGHVAQANARTARHGLLARALSAAGGNHLLMGHTADDQLETVAMRQARPGAEAGTGLAGMRRFAVSPVWPQGRGVFVCRPCLAVGRAALRAELRARGAVWADDPTNENLAYERIRVRAALAEADAHPADMLRGCLGMASEQRRAEDASLAAWLATDVEAGADGVIRVQPSDMDVSVLGEGLTHLIMAAAGTDRRADRSARLVLAADILDQPRTFRARTLGGAWIAPRQGAVHIARDPGGAPLQNTGEGLVSNVWDGRFLMQEVPRQPETAQLASNLQACEAQTGLQNEAVSPMGRASYPFAVTGKMATDCLVSERLADIRLVLEYENRHICDIKTG